jgi:hypothetical protein
MKDTVREIFAEKDEKPKKWLWPISRARAHQVRRRAGSVVAAAAKAVVAADGARASVHIIPPRAGDARDVISGPPVCSL